MNKKIFVKKIYKIISRKEVNMLPSYIAFFILISFLPILSLIFEVIFMIMENNQDFLNTLQEVLPSNVYTVTVRLVDHNPNNMSLLTMSNIVLLFLASRIYQAFHRSYLIIYDIKFKSNLIRDKIIALFNTFLLIIMIFFLTIFTMLSNYIFKLFMINIDGLFNLFSYIIPIIIISAIITFLMYSVPEMKQKVKEVFLGSLFVTFGWILVSYGFKIYTEYYANYETIYKTFATVIVFITWVYLLCYVLVIGIAINRVVSEISINENANS